MGGCLSGTCCFSPKKFEELHNEYSIHGPNNNIGYNRGYDWASSGEDREHHNTRNNARRIETISESIDQQLKYQAKKNEGVGVREIKNYDNSTETYSNNNVPTLQGTSRASQKRPKVYFDNNTLEWNKENARSPVPITSNRGIEIKDADNSTDTNSNSNVPTHQGTPEAVHQWHVFFDIDSEEKYKENARSHVPQTSNRSIEIKNADNSSDTYSNSNVPAHQGTPTAGQQWHNVFFDIDSQERNKENARSSVPHTSNRSIEIKNDDNSSHTNSNSNVATHQGTPGTSQQWHNVYFDYNTLELNKENARSSVPQTSNRSIEIKNYNNSMDTNSNSNVLPHKGTSEASQQWHNVYFDYNTLELNKEKARSPVPQTYNRSIEIKNDDKSMETNSNSNVPTHKRTPEASQPWHNVLCDFDSQEWNKENARPPVPQTSNRVIEIKNDDHDASWLNSINNKLADTKCITANQSKYLGHTWSKGQKNQNDPVRTHLESALCPIQRGIRKLPTHRDEITVLNSNNRSVDFNYNVLETYYFSPNKAVSKRSHFSNPRSNTSRNESNLIRQSSGTTEAINKCLIRKRISCMRKPKNRTVKGKSRNTFGFKNNLTVNQRTTTPIIQKNIIDPSEKHVRNVDISFVDSTDFHLDPSASKIEYHPQYYPHHSEVSKGFFPNPSSEIYRILPISNELKQIIRKRIVNKRIRVHDIEKVENKYLELSYNLKKQQKLKEQPLLQEYELFHGTKWEHLDSICKNNFNWRYCGRGTGFIFGQGVCFSGNAMYAAHYSSDVDEKVMLIAKVLVGKKCLGTKRMKLPEEGYDTAAKSLTDNIVLVKFEDNEFYPIYRIKFHLLPKEEKRN